MMPLLRVLPLRLLQLLKFLALPRLTWAAPPQTCSGWPRQQHWTAAGRRPTGEQRVTAGGGGGARRRRVALRPRGVKGGPSGQGCSGIRRACVGQ